jgi:hypothetical protein
MIGLGQAQTKRYHQLLNRCVVLRLLSLIAVSVKIDVT